MDGDGSTSGVCWQQQQQNDCYLTAMLPAAGRLPPPLRSVNSRLLELYHECMDNGGWARVLYDAHWGLEKLTIIRGILPDPTIAAPTKKCKPGRQANDRRQAWDRRRREPRRRLHSSQPCLHTPSTTEDDSPTAEPATTR
jgi:hypothetical protein